MIIIIVVIITSVSIINIKIQYQQQTATHFCTSESLGDSGSFMFSVDSSTDVISSVSFTFATRSFRRSPNERSNISTCQTWDKTLPTECLHKTDCSVPRNDFCYLGNGHVKPLYDDDGENDKKMTP